MRSPIWGALLGAAVLFAIPFCAGATSDALLRKLVDKGILTAGEADELRAESVTETAAQIKAFSKVQPGAWVKQMQWSGDLRLRAEELYSERSLDRADRLRYRFRLRLGLEVQMPEWATLGVRLATGDGDPNATNQTFTDTFRNKPFLLDLAYVSLRPPTFEQVTIIGGKMPLPFWGPAFNSVIIYDPDLTPEGVAERVTLPFGDRHRHKLFANFGQFTTKEFATDSQDSYLFDFQGGAELRFGEPQNPRVRVTSAAGYYFTHNLANPGFKVGDASNLGNAVKISGTATNCLSDFRVLRLQSEVAVQLRDRPVLGTPARVTIGGEYVHNFASAYETLAGATTNTAPEQVDGWTTQITFGGLRKKGEWQVGYQYKYLEADAMWDGISDSDWGSSGGTDRKGHYLRAGYQILDWWQLVFSAQLSEKISSRPNTGHHAPGQTGEELLRLQADSTFKF